MNTILIPLHAGTQHRINYDVCGTVSFLMVVPASPSDRSIRDTLDIRTYTIVYTAERTNSTVPLRDLGSEDARLNMGKFYWQPS